MSDLAFYAVVKINSTSTANWPLPETHRCWPWPCEARATDYVSMAGGLTPVCEEHAAGRVSAIVSTFRPEDWDLLTAGPAERFAPRGP